jgi:hypothetical protein
MATSAELEITLFDVVASRAARIVVTNALQDRMPEIIDLGHVALLLLFQTRGVVD